MRARAARRAFRPRRGAPHAGMSPDRSGVDVAFRDEDRRRDLEGEQRDISRRHKHAFYAGQRLEIRPAGLYRRRVRSGTARSLLRRPPGRQLREQPEKGDGSGGRLRRTGRPERHLRRQRRPLDDRGALEEQRQLLQGLHRSGDDEDIYRHPRLQHVRRRDLELGADKGGDSL